jgi:amino acid permease
VILIGLGINGILTLIVALIALGISTRVTEIAIIGIAERMGAWSGIIGSLLILFALVTSYWSVSLALTDILSERTHLSKKISWLLATLPSLLILWIDKWQFLEWLRLAAGATALVVALITIPMYLQARLTGTVSNPDWTLGRWGRPAMLALALFSLILMAIGSLISV